MAVKHDALGTMWDFLQMGKIPPNIPLLEESCRKLIRMLTQKTAGQDQYKKAEDVSFGELDAVCNDIVIETLCLYLSGGLGRLVEYESTGLAPAAVARILDAYRHGQTLRTSIAERLEIIRDIPTARLRELVEIARIDGGTTR